MHCKLPSRFSMEVMEWACGRIREARIRNVIKSAQFLYNEPCHELGLMILRGSVFGSASRFFDYNYQVVLEYHQFTNVCGIEILSR